MSRSGVNVVETVLLAILTSATTVGLLAFLARQYFQRWLDLHFKPQEHELQLEYDQKKMWSEKVIDGRAGVYPQLLAITYKLRKELEGSIAQDSIATWSPEIGELTYHLTQALYEGRAFLPNEAFKPLHEYKHLCQFIAVELDRLTQPTAVTDKQAYEAAKPTLINKLARLQEIYPLIESALTLQMSKEWKSAPS